jgi:predicted Rossmann-fold nucleotide-binding protein
VKILVCGGRNYQDRSRVFQVLDAKYRQYGSLQHADPFDTIIHGCAPGADRLAHEWATEKGLIVCGFPANWAIYGKAAGPIRNRAMLELRPALVVAFPGGQGTADMVAKARASSILVEEVT